MKIRIREAGVRVTGDLRGHIERRLGLGLGRFGGQIGEVRLKFSQIEGYRGAIENRCQIEVGLAPQSVKAEQIDANLAVAFDRAVDRVARAVDRELARQRLFSV